MSTTTTLDIKVIYPRSSRGRSVPRSVRATSRPMTGRAGALRLGLLNLLVAGALYYVVWWQADPFIFRTLMMKTPLPGIDITRMSSMIKPQLGEANEPHVASVPNPEISGMAAVKTIGSVAYVWLTLSTGAALALALAGGASAGSKLDPSWRRKWVILAGGAVLAILWGLYSVASNFGWTYPVDYARWGAGAFVAFAVLIGLVISGKSRALSRLAAVALIVSAIGSAVGIYLWGQCGALEGTYRSVPFILGLFGIHSIYGWLLWPLSARWGR